jgi:hypothetical protein
MTVIFGFVENEGEIDLISLPSIRTEVGSERLSEVPSHTLTSFIKICEGWSCELSWANPKTDPESRRAEITNVARRFTNMFYSLL